MAPCTTGEEDPVVRKGCTLYVLNFLKNAIVNNPTVVSKSAGLRSYLERVFTITSVAILSPEQPSPYNATGRGQAPPPGQQHTCRQWQQRENAGDRFGHCIHPSLEDPPGGCGLV